MYVYIYIYVCCVVHLLLWIMNCTRCMVQYVHQNNSSYVSLMSFLVLLCLLDLLTLYKVLGSQHLQMWR